MPFANTWAAWAIDHQTVGWIVWLLFFVVWEAYTLIVHPGQELTAHVRPLFLEHPTTWFIALGLWLWTGAHFLAPNLEKWIIETASR
jgi:hypothetical protein